MNINQTHYARQLTEKTCLIHIISFLTMKNLNCNSHWSVVDFPWACITEGTMTSFAIKLITGESFGRLGKN